MMGHSHVVLGAACYLALLRHPLTTPFGILEAPVLGGPALHAAPALALIGVSMALASASALGPDIDKRGSSIARAGGWGTGVLAWGLEHAVHHRGPFHSLLSLLGVVLLGNAVGLLLGVSGFGAVLGFGWAAHLLGDVGTRRGIPLFWPARQPVRSPVTFITGTWQEALVLAGALAVCLAWGAQLHLLPVGL